MSASMSLTTLARVKAYLGLAGDDQDELLQTIIDGVSQAIEQLCGRPFAEVERTEFHDGQGSSALVLRCRPVTDVASLRDDPSGTFPEGSELAAASYAVYPEEGILERKDGCFADGRRNVRVVYTAGYATAPPAVEQAATILVATLYNRGRGGGDGLSSESLGAYAVAYADGDWPGSVHELLFPYREVTP